MNDKPWAPGTAADTAHGSSPRGTRTAVAGLIAFFVTAVGLVGCGNSASDEESEHTTGFASTTVTGAESTQSSAELPASSQGRDGPVIHHVTPPSPTRDMALIQGSLSIDGKGCIRVDSWGVIWPAGTSWDDANDEVVMEDGRRFGLGHAVSGEGEYQDSVGAGDGKQSSLESKVGSTVAAHAVACYGEGQVAVLNNWSGAIGEYVPEPTNQRSDAPNADNHSG